MPFIYLFIMNDRTIHTLVFLLFLVVLSSFSVVCECCLLQEASCLWLQLAGEGLMVGCVSC